MKYFSPEVNFFQLNNAEVMSTSPEINDNETEFVPAN